MEITVIERIFAMSSRSLPALSGRTPIISGGLLSFLALSMAVLSLSPAQASAAKIVNRSGVPIDELSIATPGTKEWGPNLLEGVKEGALDSGKTLLVKGISDGTYDFQISAPDEAIFCTMEKVTVSNGTALLTKTMGKACK
jgi:hypothetical protein